MDRERFRELSVEFLLGTLEGSELTEFQAELERRGDEGQRELAEIREALGLLALSARASSPGAALRARILHDVQQDPAPAGSGVAPVPEPGRILPMPRQAAAWSAAAAIAAVLATLLAIWNVDLRNQVSRKDGELESLRRQLATADSTVQRLDAERRDLEALTSPTAVAHNLVGTDSEPDAVARVFVDPETGRALLFAFELPILPPDKVYELWAIKRGVPIAVGTFSTGPDRRARLELPDASVFEGAEALAVTIEPAPGTKAPTGPMVLTSSS